MTEFESGKVSRREFVQRVARRAGVSVPVATSVYAAMVGEILELVTDGNDVVLTGFGKFSRQNHKGHVIRDRKTGELQSVDDYTVLRFSATRDVNRSLSTVVSASR